MHPPTPPTPPTPPIPALSAEELARALAWRDLTDPRGGGHALQLLVDVAVDALVGAWSCAVRRHRADPVIPIADNYDVLGYPPEAVAREARYTRYVDRDRVLRTHTSAMIPPLLRELAQERSGSVDVLLACPGMVYRRDAIDRLHTGTPHQLDLWRIATRPLGHDDLRDMLEVLVAATLPDRRWRTVPATHPYTLDGLQVDVEADGAWVEVAECGIADPGLIARCGLTPPGYQGLALGLGLDRLLMVRKGVPDIRLLRATNPRVAGQMLDLEPWRPVSNQPAVVRDLSIAVSEDDTAEDLGDRVRAALGDLADAVEEVTVLAETPGPQVPGVASERLGLRPGQKNLLVRVVLRHLDRALTRAEANQLRDRIYVSLHQGTGGERTSDG